MHSMSDPSGRSFTGDFKRFFLRGLVVLLPSVLTLWIVVKAYQFIDNTIAEPINRGVRVMLVNTARVWEPLQEIFDPTEAEIQKEMAAIEASGASRPDPAVIRARLRRDNIVQWWANHWYMDLIGLFVAIIAVYVAGRLLGGFFGRRIYRKVEDIITTLPIFKQVYPYVKQVVDFLFSDERPIKFNRVVAVEYPRKGIWSVGFLTGATLRSIQARAGDSVTVFIPSSPTPFTGYTITVRRADIIELPLTVEEAIRFAVSGGVLVPGHEQNDADEEAARASRATEPPTGLIPLPRDPASEEARADAHPPRDSEQGRGAG
jgi:uncharacterized membrane protein